MKTQSTKATWQVQLRKALQAEGYLIFGKIYSDKRNEGRRYKFSVSKQGITEYQIVDMTEKEKNKAHQIVKSIVPDAEQYGGWGDSILTYIRFI